MRLHDSSFPQLTGRYPLPHLTADEAGLGWRRVGLVTWTDSGQRRARGMEQADAFDSESGMSNGWLDELSIEYGKGNGRVSLMYAWSHEVP